MDEQRRNADGAVVERVVVAVGTERCEAPVEEALTSRRRGGHLGVQVLDEVGDGIDEKARQRIRRAGNAHRPAARHEELADHVQVQSRHGRVAKVGVRVEKRDGAGPLRHPDEANRARRSRQPAALDEPLQGPRDLGHQAAAAGIVVRARSHVVQVTQQQHLLLRAARTRNGRREDFLDALLEPRIHDGREGDGPLRQAAAKPFPLRLRNHEGKRRLTSVVGARTEHLPVHHVGIAPTGVLRCTSCRR